MEIKPIKKKELVKIYNQVFDQTLKKLGFYRKEQQFFKYEDGYYYLIIYGVADYGLKWVDYSFNFADVSLMNQYYFCTEQFERICSKPTGVFYGIDSAYLERETNSLKHFEIWTEEQAEESINKIINYMTTVFIPDTDNLKTIEAINERLNESAYHEVVLGYGAADFFSQSV